MKNWEENRRKQLYNKKISQAKPTLSVGTQPKKQGTKVPSTNVSSSKGFNHTNTSVSTKIGGIALAVSEEIFSDHNGEVKISDLPIFQLLKAFKLQQYALKLAELGYGEDIYKLALLNDRQRGDLVIQLKVLPGHNAKLVSLFDVIDELYPKKAVAKQLKQFTPGGSTVSSERKPKRITSAYRPRQGMMHQTTSKSLLQQYENLDPLTKQAFNETFLVNLESVKHNMGKLISQHVNREESKAAINYIFPPQQYLGTGAKVLDVAKQDDQYNKEIENLLKKYTANTQYSGFNNKDVLEKRTGYHQQQELKQGMAQAMRDIDQINKHLEQFIKPQSALSDQQRPSKPSTSQTDQRPSTKQTTKAYEVFNDDKDKSRISIKDDFDQSMINQTHTQVLEVQSEDIRDSEDPTQTDISISESQINEALNILNDPLALSLAVKEQYNQIVKQNKQQQEDASFLNPLAQGDDSKLNVTTKYYQKQVVYDEPPTVRRPMSPLIEKDERDRLWNCGQSLDSKQVTSALGYLDLKQICYCLANALLKHIEFSQGFYFLDDLQEHLRQTAGGESDRNPNFDFTYNINAELKIDIEKAKQKKLEKEQARKNEFEALKSKMKLEEQKQQTIKQSKTVVLDQQTPKQKPQDEVEEEIKDETIDQGDDDIQDESDYIQDYYEDVSDKQRDQDQPMGGEYQDDNDEIDFDYSQTHLEDFLKSQTGNTMLKNTNIQSSQLLNTFLSSYSKMKSGASFRESNLGQQLTSKNFKATKGMNPIDEKLEQSESEKSETRTKRLEPSDSEEDDNFGRSGEKIDLGAVEVKSTKTPAKQTKPILTPQQIEQARKEEEKKSKVPQIQIDVKTKQGFKDLLRFQLRIFDANYDFEKDQLVGGESEYLGNPTLEELYYYCKYVIISGRMEKEIPILCLNYIERFLTKTGVLMNHANWRRLTLISLTLASKIWDDDSLENVHFPQVMPDVTLKEIASLEKVFLQLIDFDLIIKGAEYAKYYFILKHFAEKFNSTLPMGPLTVEQMSDLQNNTVKAESNLRERYNVKLSLKKTM